MQLIAVVCLVSRTRMPLAYYCRTSFLLSSFNLEEKRTLHRYIIHVGSIRGIYTGAHG